MKKIFELSILFALTLFVAAKVSAATPTPPLLVCDANECVSEEPYALGNVPFSYSWPTAPNTTSTENVSSIGQLQAAVSTSGTRVVVEPGTYNGNVVISGSDIEIVMSNSATINGSVQFGSGGAASRIRWTGGNVTAGPFNIRNATDVLLNNLNVLTNGNGDISNDWTGGSARIAAINSTFELRGADQGNGFTLFTMPVGNRDWIFANIRVESDGQNNRFQGVSNVIIVDSYFNANNRSSNGRRYHHVVQNVYERDNIIVGLAIMGRVGSSTDAGVVNGTFERVTRYMEGNHFAFFGNAGSRSSGIVVDSPINGTTSPSGGEVPLFEFAGSNNIQRPWNGSTLPSPAGYGADH